MSVVAAALWLSRMQLTPPHPQALQVVAAAAQRVRLPPPAHHWLTANADAAHATFALRVLALSAE
jgi:hypothetical protein